MRHHKHEFRRTSRLPQRGILQRMHEQANLKVTLVRGLPAADDEGRARYWYALIVFRSVA
jgi:hypothetical protein